MTSSPSSALAGQRRGVAHRLAKTLDLVLATIVGATFGLLVVPALFVRGRLRRRPSPRSILHLVNGSIEATKWRNGLYYYGSKGLLGDLDGYFDRVVTLFFLTEAFRTERVTDRGELIDFHLDGAAWLDKLGLSATRVVSNVAAYLVFATELVAKGRIGIIQVADPYVSGLLGWVLSLLTGSHLVVLVMSHYDMHFARSGRPMYARFASRRIEKFIETRVSRRASLVLADRAFYARYAIDNGCDPERVAVFPATVHEDFYLDPLEPSEARKRFDLRPEGLVMLYVGRLNPEKHVMDLPEVLASTRKKVPSAKLLIVGDGILREQLRERSRELGVLNEMLFVGALDIDALRLAFAAADVVLGTHMGFTLLEASLAAKPIVAYDWEWHPELIETGRTGILVPFGDRSAMAVAAAVLLEDLDRAREMGRRARRSALENHAIGQNVDSLRHAYQGLEV